MTFLALVLAASVSAQSLAEVAEKERKRRERNEEAGIEVVSYTDSSVDGVVASRPSGETETEEEVPAAQAEEEPGEDVSPLEEARERGRILEPRMAQISAMADRVDRMYERYMNECYGRYMVGATPPGVGIPSQPPPPVHVQMGRGWFIVLDTPSALTTPVSRGGGGNFILVEPPPCQTLRERLIAAAIEVQRAMRELLDLARRERILAGVVRELRKKHRLEWSGWER